MKVTPAALQDLIVVAAHGDPRARTCTKCHGTLKYREAYGRIGPCYLCAGQGKVLNDEGLIARIDHQLERENPPENRRALYTARAALVRQVEAAAVKPIEQRRAEALAAGKAARAAYDAAVARNAPAPDVARLHAVLLDLRAQYAKLINA